MSTLACVAGRDEQSQSFQPGEFGVLSNSWDELNTFHKGGLVLHNVMEPND